MGQWGPIARSSVSIEHPFPFERGEQWLVGQAWQQCAVQGRDARSADSSGNRLELHLADREKVSAPTSVSATDTVEIERSLPKIGVFGCGRDTEIHERSADRQQRASPDLIDGL